jgi:hypothetical protein
MRRHVRQRTPTTLAGEDIGIGGGVRARGRDLIEDLDRPIGERDAVLAAGLHSRRRHGPDFRLEVDLGQRAPVPSPVLAAMRIVNSSARAAWAGRSRSFSMKPGTSA